MLKTKENELKKLQKSTSKNYYMPEAPQIKNKLTGGIGGKTGLRYTGDNNRTN